MNWNRIIHRSYTAARGARWLITTLLVAMLSGACATAGAITKPPATAVPGAWTRTADGMTTASAGDLARWWERLGDPVLSGLVDQALKASPDLRVASARLRQARAQRNLAQANLLPSVSASGSVSTDKRTSSASTSLSSSIDASWEPDVFGAGRSAVSAAQADLAATGEDLHNTQVSLAAEVAINYVDLRGAQARLAIAQKNLASQNETFQLTQWRAQAGLVSSVDVEQARANVAQTQAQVPTLQTTIAQAEHRIAVLTGQQPGALTAQLDVAAAIPATPDQIAVGIPAETLRQRPDVRAAEQRVIAETARVAQAKAARYPNFKLQGSLGTELVTGVMTGGTSVIASLAASVAQTIFDGGRIRQQIEIQNAVQEQAVATYESTVLTALEDVENALVSLQQDRDRLTALTTQAEAARNAALLATQQYTAGLTDFQTVLDTERTVLSAEDNLAATQASRTTALIQLYKALGGGWSQSDAAPTGSASAKS